jgi:hypothetical protein
MLEQKRICEVGLLRHPPRAMSLRADRPFKKKIIQCEAADVVAQARAAESIGISFQNPLALAMGRFRLQFCAFPVKKEEKAITVGAETGARRGDR